VVVKNKGDRGKVQMSKEPKTEVEKASAERGRVGGELGWVLVSKRTD